MLTLGHILGGSDNLFKYLFTVAILLGGLALLYPLQKQQELDLQELEANKAADMLELEIAAIDTLISLARRDGVIDSSEYRKVSELFTASRPKRVELDFQASKQALLSSQSDTYNKYKTVLTIIALIFGVFGLTGWAIQTWHKMSILRQQAKGLDDGTKGLESETKDSVRRHPWKKASKSLKKQFAKRKSNKHPS